VLLALAASIVVAIAEGVLYLIWSSHAEERKERQKRRKAAKAKPKVPLEEEVTQDEGEVQIRDGSQNNVFRRKGYEHEKEEVPVDL
jgi:membrane protein implicated in regulation of membrane protease activity